MNLLYAFILFYEFGFPVYMLNSIVNPTIPIMVGPLVVVIYETQNIICIFIGEIPHKNNSGVGVLFFFGLLESMYKVYSWTV